MPTPSWNTESHASARCSRASSRSHDQAMTAVSVWWRAGADRSRPRSTAKRSSSRWRSSSSDMRADPGRRELDGQRQARRAGPPRRRRAPGRALRWAARRSPGVRTARRRRPAASWSSRTTCSAAMFRGARLVVTTLRSRAVTRRNATSEATASTTCSQLSSTSRVGAVSSSWAIAAPDVGELRRGVRTPRGDRVAHAERRADLGDDVVGRGDADQLDEVDPRLGRLAGQHVRDPGLADPARTDDRGEPAGAHRRRAAAPGRRRGRAAPRRRSGSRCAPARRPASSSRCSRCRPSAGSTPSRSRRSDR